MTVDLVATAVLIVTPQLTAPEQIAASCRPWSSIEASAFAEQHVLAGRLEVVLVAIDRPQVRIAVAAAAVRLAGLPGRVASGPHHSSFEKPWNWTMLVTFCSPVAAAGALVRP